MRLTFLGAAGTVTGSKYLLEGGGSRILIDCGLFQGLKELRLRNWEAPPVDPRTLDAVVLTHAHLDHSGYLPRLVREGFKGPVWCTPGTRDLAHILLPDSAHLQDEDARFANKRGFSKHRPALPLYTPADAEAALALFQTVAYDEVIEIGGLRIRMTPSGHMLGSACVRVEDEHTNIVFTGDVGRPDDLLFAPPRPLHDVRNLVVESTYGDRRHSPSDPSAELADVVRRVVGRGGVVMIPAFAVGRSQQILLQLARLRAAGEIPDVPVFLNSPMAIDAMQVFLEHPAEHRLTPADCEAMRHAAAWVRTPEESKKLNLRQDPMILLAGSGMMTGGRILHHLKAFGPDPRNALLLVGYQAAGTRGQALDNGAEEVKIHGEYVPIRAERVRIDGLSGHADYAELCQWLRSVEPAPRRVFVTHGDPAASDAFRRHLRDRLGWEATIPRHGEHADVS
ncbi:MAG: MBL fold metallo-hydrolase [Pseudomonadota bacterium]|nr:MBL fold metallo-hydrolase [Pseudomonadota bacterium]